MGNGTSSHPLPVTLTRPTLALTGCVTLWLSRGRWVRPIFDLQPPGPVPHVPVNALGQSRPAAPDFRQSGIIATWLVGAVDGVFEDDDENLWHLMY